MALPTQLKSARLDNNAIGDQIDNAMGALELALTDIFGMPIDTNITAALLEVVAGGLKTIKLIDAAADPLSAGHIRLNGANLKYHDGTVVRTVPKIVTTKIWIPGASVDGTAAAPCFDLPATNGPTANAYGTDPHKFGGLSFGDDVARTAEISLHLPSDWYAADGIDIKYVFHSSSSIGNNVMWTCASKSIADGEDVLAPTFNATQTVTKANNTTANTRNSASINGVDTTGLAAGELAIFRIGRDPTVGSNLVGAVILEGIELSLRRSL